jgi:PAS domain S-box-containing protein
LRVAFPRHQKRKTVMLGITVLVLAALVGLSYRQWGNYRRANAEAERGRELVTAIDSVLIAVVDAETGQRGFLLTGENRYLEPYDQAIQELPNDLATLKRLLRDRQGGEQQFSELNSLAERRLDELRRTIEVRRTQGAQAALAMVRTEDGKRTMDSIRVLCVQMRRNELASQVLASDSAQAAEGVALLITVAGSMVLLFLFAFGFEPFASPDPQAWGRSWILRYGAAILAVASMALVRAALTPLIGPTNFPFTLFFCAVMFAAWFGGFRPAVLSIALSLLAGDWFFALPRWSLRVSGRDDQVAMLVLVLVGFGTALLSRSQRRAVDRALLAEASERNERQRFETTLVSIGDAVIATDAGARIMLMNRVAEKLTGWSDHEAKGKPLTEVFRILNQETREPVENPVEKVRRLNQVVGLANHTILISRNGQEFAIDDSGAPIRGTDGLLAGVVLVFRDVTEARKAEKRFSLALTTGKMGVYEMDLGHNTLWLSPESHWILGTMPQDFGASPQPFLRLVHPQDRELLLQHVNQSIKAHEPINHEFRIQRPGGKEFWVNCQGEIEYNESGRAVRHSGLLIDITLRKESERMLRRWEKLATAARLSAAMAHEINNPLGAVINLIYLARCVPGTSNSAIELLTQAEQELERVAHATRQTLGFYREPSMPERIDLEALVESVLKLYSTKLVSKHISIERAFAPCAPIYGVRGEIRQAFSNVIANAIEAVAQGGVIVIGIQPVPGGNNETVEIVVADDGPGIAAEDVNRIFEPFFSKKRGTGMGLGLWVAKEIVERHGGTITVSPRAEENELRGATFTIRFPRASSPRSDERKVSSDEPSTKA